MKLKRTEAILLAALLLVCAAAGLYFYLPRRGGAVAVITVDSVERWRVDLTKNQRPFTFRIEDATGKPVSFEVRDGAVRFVDVTCPDHICEKAGWCRSPGDRAVCMPNRTTLVCYDRRELPPAQEGVAWVAADNHP